MQVDATKRGRATQEGYRMAIDLFGTQMREDADRADYEARSTRMNDVARQIPGFNWHRLDESSHRLMQHYVARH